MTAVKLYKSPLKGLKILALTIPFVAIGVWMILETPIGSFDYRIAWFCACFFGLGIPVGLFQVFDRRPQIIITEHGIWDRTNRQGEIHWDQIKDAYPLDIFKQQFVSLVLDDTFMMKKKLYKWAGNLHEAIGAQKVNLLLSQLNVDKRRMAAFIKEMAGAEKQNRYDILKKYFHNLQ